MNVYSSLAKEINSDTKITSNVIDIGEIKSLDPMSISLSDILLDEDDIILTDKIQKLIEPLIPEYEEDKLKVGDKVVLYSIEDGQKFIVIDRVVL